MSTKKKGKVNWGWILIIIIVIGLILFLIINKENERKRLKEISEILNKRIDMIHTSINERKKLFNIAYIVLKTIFLFINIFICILISRAPESKDFFSLIGNCINVYAAFGLILLFTCFILESDPINIFQLRNILKTNLHRYFFRSIEDELEALPTLENELEEINKLLVKKDENNL